jgi:hypothetical protein
VFLDEHQVSIDDGTFGVAPEGDKWYNLPANWHNRGSVLNWSAGRAVERSARLRLRKIRGRDEHYLKD